MESGYRLAVVLTLVFDGLRTVFLGFFVSIVAPPLVRSIANERRETTKDLHGSAGAPR
jgi:hypothetical protein